MVRRGNFEIPCVLYRFNRFEAEADTNAKWWVIRKSNPAIITSGVYNPDCLLNSLITQKSKMLPVVESNHACLGQNQMCNRYTYRE